MTTSYTVSQTSTFTEARARAVMRHVLGDFMNLAGTGLIKRETLQEWHEELEYAVSREVVEKFQLQFTKSNGTRLGLTYSVKDDGSVLEESKAGGVDFFGLPADTKVGLLLTYRAGAPRLEEVRAYLRARGWTTGGSAISGDPVRDRAFSKDGYGVVRTKIGDWS
ncbi:MAG: hypothetical protein U0359_39925 [Byssovorax sp.]